MKYSYSRGMWASLFGLALASQACTVVTADDKDEKDDAADDGGVNSETEETEPTEESDSDPSTTPSSEEDTESDVPSTSSDEETASDTGEVTSDKDGGASSDETTDETTGDSGPGETEPTTEDSDTTPEETSTEPEGDGGPTTPTATIPAFDCGSPDTSDATTLSGYIEEDQTWSGVIVVEGEVHVEAVTITIEPGTQFVMGVDSMIEFGWNGTAATLKANGTEADPITFCGSSDEPGFWNVISVGDNVTSDSTLKNALIKNAGGYDSDTATALYLASDILIENVVVKDSGGIGVTAVDFDEDSSGLFITGSEEFAASLTNPKAVTNFPADSLISGNTSDFAVVNVGYIEDDTTFHDLGIPYLVPGTLNTQAVDIVIEAGVEMAFGSDAALVVGWNGSDASLKIEGTEADPVVFRGQHEETGYWYGVIIEGNVRSESDVEHLEIRHAGGADVAALRVRSPITISHLTLDTNDTGVILDAPGVADDSTDWTITTTGSVPMTIESEALTALPKSGAFTGNNQDAIAVNAGYPVLIGTVLDLGVPYLIKGSVNLSDGTNVTIAPGTEFEMSSDSSLEVGWNGGQAEFHADGTEAEPIRFTGTQDRAAYWTGIFIGDNVDSASSMQWVEIDDGGLEGGAALKLRSPILVKDCTISDSEGWGIMKNEADEADYEADNTFENVAEGNVTNN